MVDIPAPALGTNLNPNTCGGKTETQRAVHFGFTVDARKKTQLDQSVDGSAARTLREPARLRLIEWLGPGARFERGMPARSPVRRPFPVTET